MFSIAVGQLVPDDAPPGWVGSAFVISGEYALTARHVLCPPSGNGTSSAEPSATGRLFFADGATTPFVLEDHDADLDVALLRITVPPANLRSIPLGALRFHTDDSALAVGWPLARPFSGDPDYVRAIVDSPDATIFGGVPALKLYSPEAAAGKALQGLSGGPVLFRTSADVGTGPGFAVGIVRWNPPRPDGTALGGAFYATPVDAVIKRWPDLLRCVPPRRNLPSASKIEQFLADQLGTAVDHRPFGGRSAELGRLDAWLRSADGPSCMLVTAPSGAGKSTLLARWWQQLANTPSDEEGSLFVPISARYDLGGADAVLQAAVARLALLHDEDPRATQTASVDQLRERLADYLALPAPHQGRLVLVLDGLDECLGWDVSKTLLRPASFGSGVHVAVSARLTGQRPDAKAWRDALGWPSRNTESLSLLPLTEDGVGAALRSLEPPLDVTTQDQARPILHQVTQGDALVLGLYLQELQDASDRPAWLAELEHLPAPYGLDGYMQRWWAGQELLWGGPIASRGARVGQLYSLLACALGPIRRLDLLWIAKRFGLSGGDELTAALSDLGRWVITDSAETTSNTTYALSHPRLAEHRRSELARDGELSRYDEAYLSWGRTTLQAVQQGSEAARAAHTYPVRFYGAHLERAHATAAELFALVGADWGAAWEFATEEFQGHLGDVQRAFRAAEAENDDAIASGRMATGLPAQIACQVAMAEASVNAALIAPGLVAQLRHHGLWTDRQALAYVQSLASPYERGHALRLVAPELSRAASEHVAVLCTALQEEGEPEAVVEAMVGCVLHLAGTGQVDRAFAALSTLPYEFQQAHIAAALELAQVLNGDTRTHLVRTVFAIAAREPPAQALGIIQSMTEQIDRETAAGAIGQDPAWEALRLLGAQTPLPLTSTDDVFADLDLLKLVAPWIPDTCWPEISEAVGMAAQARNTLEALGDRLSRLRREKEHALNDQDFELAALLRDQERNLLGDISDRKDLAVWAEQAAELMPYLSGEVAAMVRAHGAKHLTSSSLGRLLPRLHGRARADTLRDLGARLSEDPERADRRELLHAFAVDGQAEWVLDFIAGHPALPGLLDDLGAVAEFLDAHQARKMLSLVRDAGVEVGLPPTAESAALAALAAGGTDEAAEALDLARAGDTSGNAATALAKTLLTPSVPIPEIADAIGLDSLRCAALTVLPPSRAITAEETLSVIRTFRSHHFAVETLRTLLPRIAFGELATAELRAISEALGLLGEHPELDDILLHHLTRVAARDGFEGARTAALSLYPLPPELPDALAAVAASRAGCQATWCPGARNRLGDAVLHELASQDAPERVLEADYVPRELLEVDSRLGRLFLLAVPDEVRREHLDSVLPDELIRGGSFFRRSDLWAGALARLLAVFDAAHLDRLFPIVSSLRLPDARLSPVSRGHLLAAAAVRYAELGEVAAAFALLPGIPFATERSHALAGMAEFLPAASLIRWAECVTIEMDGFSSGAFGWRAVVWARAASRWEELGLSDRWLVVRTWLRQVQHSGREDLAADLLGLSPLLLSVGGPELGRGILDEFTHSRHIDDADGPRASRRAFGH